MKRTNPLSEMDDSGSRIALPQYSKGPWEIVECRTTGMVYLANPPEYSQLADEFEWEKSYLKEKADRKKREPVVSFVSGITKKIRLKFQKQQRIVRLCVELLREQNVRGIGSLRVLDVGCASADKLVQIAEIAAGEKIAITPVGVEISPPLSKIARERLEAFGGGCIQNSAIEGLAGVQSGSVDLIILCTFLEHEINPLPLLRVCREKLSAQGRVIIKVPNYDCLNRKIRQGRWCGFRYPDHVNYFTPRTLRLMVDRAGMKVRRMGLMDRFPTSDNMYAIIGH